MKKLSAIVLIAVMLIGMCACAKDPATTGPSLAPNTTGTAGTTLAPTEPTEPATTVPPTTVPPTTAPEVTEPATEPTEPATEPTEPATEPTEPPTEPTEPPTEPTEPPTEPTEPPTEPTEPPTEPTEPPVVECSHDYKIACSVEATCAEFGSLTYQCSKCGHSYQLELPKTEHTFADATCTEPKTCTACGATDGNAKGHTFADATCTAPQTCTVCGATQGNAKGHKWTDATCKAPKTCSVCAATEGNVADHKYENDVCVYCGIADPNAVPANETVVLHSAKAEGYVTGQMYVYTTTSGFQKQELVMDGTLANAIAFKLIQNADGTVSFQTSCGKYLFCDGTHVTFADKESDYTRFVLEAVDSSYYIRCAVATYYEKAQYLEVYSGYLTCYGMSTSSDEPFRFTLQDGTGALGTVKDAVAEEDPEEPDDNDNTGSTGEGVTATYTQTIADGDKVVIFYPDAMLAVSGTADGKRLEAVEATVADSVLTSAEAAVWEVVVDDNGYYSFLVDGMYLTSGATGNSLYLAEEASEYSLWELEEAADGWYIRNVNAQYSGNAQYLEYYYDFTTYGFKESNTTIYTFQFFIVND